jgi:formylglycine-generating enzyme required for sulfatase activity
LISHFNSSPAIPLIKISNKKDIVNVILRLFSLNLLFRKDRRVLIYIPIKTTLLLTNNYLKMVKIRLFAKHCIVLFISMGLVLLAGCSEESPTEPEPSDPFIGKWKATSENNDDEMIWAFEYPGLFFIEWGRLRYWEGNYFLLGPDSFAISYWERGWDMDGDAYGYDTSGANIIVYHSTRKKYRVALLQPYQDPTGVTVLDYRTPEIRPVSAAPDTTPLETVPPSGMKPVNGATFYFARGIPEDTVQTKGILETVSSFWMDSIEVTQSDFQALMGYNPSVHQDNLCPVANVTYYDVALYCNARSKQDGLDTAYVYNYSYLSLNDSIPTLNALKLDLNTRGYRLPTDVEWEYAARAGTQTRFFWGDTFNSAFAWFSDNADIPQQVATRQPNALGLYDMVGNVWEWCAEFSFVHGETGGQGYYGRDYYNAKGEEEYVVRGGDIFSTGSSFYYTYHKGYQPSRSDSTVGFRCVLNR